MAWLIRWPREIYGASSGVSSGDLTLLLTSLSDASLTDTLALDCQTVTITNYAVWLEWLSEPGLDLFSDPAVYLSGPAEKKGPFNIILIKKCCIYLSSL